MNPDSAQTTPTPWRYLTAFSLILAAACLLAIGLIRTRDDWYMRGIPAGLPESIPQGGARLGINVYLDDLDDTQLNATLSDIRATRIDYVKQSFYFNESFDWTTADRLVDAISAEGLTLVPLLDGDPETNFAPPENIDLYAEWVGEFAHRYGDRLSHYIIWDEPNLTSHWGGQPVNPNEYAALLSAAAVAIRTHDADAVIVAAPLAPTTEMGPDNLTEPLYLGALYEAGAAGAFDVIAAKPYGFAKELPRPMIIAVRRLTLPRRK